MTFQLGMVGTDGILIASDRLSTQSGILGQTYAGAFHTDKIMVIESKKLAYCCAGDQLSIIAGQRIVDRIEEPSWEGIRQALVVCAAEVAAEERKRSADKQSWEKLRGGSLLLAYCKYTPLELWQLDIPADGMPCAHKISDKIRIGDSTTPASFFLERYYRERPVEELIFLAAHTVLTAGAMNPAGVGGLDIVLCKPSGCEVLTQDRIGKLRARSEKLHTQIASSLVPPDPV